MLDLRDQELGSQVENRQGCRHLFVRLFEKRQGPARELMSKMFLLLLRGLRRILVLPWLMGQRVRMVDLAALGEARRAAASWGAASWGAAKQVVAE